MQTPKRPASPGKERLSAVARAIGKRLRSPTRDSAPVPVETAPRRRVLTGIWRSPYGDEKILTPLVH